MALCQVGRILLVAFVIGISSKAKAVDISGVVEQEPILWLAVREGENFKAGAHIWYTIKTSNTDTADMVETGDSGIASLPLDNYDMPLTIEYYSTCKYNMMGSKKETLTVNSLDDLKEMKTVELDIELKTLKVAVLAFKRRQKSINVNFDIVDKNGKTSKFVSEIRRERDAPTHANLPLNYIDLPANISFSASRYGRETDVKTVTIDDYEDEDLNKTHEIELKRRRRG